MHLDVDRVDNKCDVQAVKITLRYLRGASICGTMLILEWDQSGPLSSTFGPMACVRLSLVHEAGPT